VTPKQIYRDLATIAGHTCANGEPFLLTKRVTAAHLAVVQSRLRALMDKLSYERTHLDFGSRPSRRTHASRTRTPAVDPAITEGMIQRARIDMTAAQLQGQSFGTRYIDEMPSNLVIDTTDEE
jgi:hypothetical protein